MQHILLIAVPALYGGIQALEMSAVLARIAGMQMGRNMTGYALQQSIYIGTRFLLVMLLPLLGLAVDLGMSPEKFALMAHLSLLNAALLGLIIILFRNRIISYYCGVLRAYDHTDNYVRSFFSPDYSGGRDHILSLALPRDRYLVVSGVIVFSVYAIGMFIAFFAAVTFPEYRASISQSSGIINALGAVLLTFFIEPAISRNIDIATDEAPKMIFALLFARWLSVALIGQLVLVGLFAVIG